MWNTIWQGLKRLFRAKTDDQSAARDGTISQADDHDQAISTQRRLFPKAALGMLSGATLAGSAAAQTWKPAGTDASTKVDKAGDTMTGTLSIVGGNLVVKNNSAGQYSYIEMFDDDSPNGRKYVHANSNSIGFVGGNGGWILQVNESGQLWSPNYGWLHSYFMRVGPDQTDYTTGTFTATFPYVTAWTWDTTYANVDGGAIRRRRTYYSNCNCDCNCNCNCQCK